MDSSSFLNIRVRAYLRTPIVSDEWLPLDGVLLYQHVRSDIGVQEFSISGASILTQPKGEPIKGGRMPIAIVHGKDWYYRCSWAQWGPHADGQDYWSKRFDMTHASLIDFNGKRGRVDTSAATYKAYRMLVFYRSALWVEWYMKCDENWLRNILPMITHLGKKTSQGWGRVMNWEIEPIEKDMSIWKEGKLMRGIPIIDLPKDFVPSRIGYYGVRPPYWDNRNQMELVLP